MTKFLKRVWRNYSKLGRGKKKKQNWRRPRGRDNKMREMRKGYPAVVKIGYQGDKTERKKIVVIQNIRDLDKIKQGEIVVVGNIGKRKKIEIAKVSLERGILFQNLKADQLLKESANKITEVKTKNESK